MKIYASSRSNDLTRYVGKPIWLLVGKPGYPQDFYIKIVTLNDPEYPKWPVKYYLIRSFDLTYQTGLYDEHNCTHASFNNFVFKGEAYTDEEMREMIAAENEDE